MKYSKNIVENNLKDAMEYFQSIDNNYLATFKQVKNNLINKEYHSIPSNYVALFLHQMIKNNADIESFNEVIQYIYNSDIKIENSLHRFFGGSCCDISFTKYIELQQPNVHEEDRKYSIWSELSYFFYDLKNNSYGLDKEKIPYLESMVKLIPEKRIDELYSSGFMMFLILVINNIDDLAPIFKAVEFNDAVKGSITYNKKPFFNLFFRGLSDISYNLNEDEKIIIYNSLSKSVQNFEEIFLNRFLEYYPTDKHNKFAFDLGMSNFLDVIGSDKVFNHIDKVYKSISSKEKQANSHKKNPYDIELNVASEISSSLQVSFDKKDFTIDYNIIDINKPFLDNFIYIKLLDIQIMTRKDPKVGKSVRDYIINEFAIDDSGPWSELESILNKKEITKYFEYLEMADDLSINPNTKTRIKL
jgi:hypothetical protein